MWCEGKAAEGSTNLDHGIVHYLKSRKNHPVYFMQSWGKGEGALQIQSRRVDLPTHTFQLGRVNRSEGLFLGHGKKFLNAFDFRK